EAEKSVASGKWSEKSRKSSVERNGAEELATDHWPLFLSPHLLLNFDIQAADFLIQCGKRDLEVFRGFGLVPVALFEHVADDAPLHILHNFKQRRIRGLIVQCECGTPAQQVIGQQVQSDFGSGRQ